MDRPRHTVAASAFIRNSQDDILLIENPERGWEIPGGLVEPGEDLISALRREIMEESGINVSIGDLAGIYARLKPSSMVLFCFLCEWVSGALRTSPESIAVEWAPRGAVLGRITHAAIRARVSDMLEHRGGTIYRSYSVDPYQVHETRFL